MLWHPYVLDGERGIGLRCETRPRQLEIRDPARPFNDELIDTRWTFSDGDFTIGVFATTFHDGGLVDFMQTLAGDFRGWEDTRHWRALENLDLEATNPGKGHVLFELKLDHTADPESWRFSVPFEVEAGETMQRLSGLVADLYADL